MDTEDSFPEISGRGVKLTIHFHLVPRLRTDRIKLLLHPYAFREHRLHYTCTFNVLLFES
jgi:hypothetical protein